MRHWSSKLFSSPVEVVVPGYDDPHLSYEFDITDIVRVEGQWYIVGDSGCSCWSPGDSPSVDFGPSDLDGLRAYLDKEYPQDYYKDEFLPAMYEALDKAAQVA